MGGRPMKLSFAITTLLAFGWSGQSHVDASTNNCAPLRSTAVHRPPVHAAPLSVHPECIPCKAMQAAPQAIWFDPPSSKP
jgi:hypothetical protein